MTRRVLITGATGDTGRSAVAESLARGLSVRALVHRKDARSAALEQLGAEVVTGDLLKIDTVVAAMEDVAAAYFVYPIQPGVLNATVNFAQAARENGVTALVNLSQRSASRSSLSDDSKDTWIAEQVLNWSGLPVTHLRPTFFLEWLLYPWQLPSIASEGILRLPVGNGRHAAISAYDQGRVIAAVLHEPGPHAGKTYPLFGLREMDHTQLVAELSEALGRTIRFEDVSIESYTRTLQAAGLPAYTIQHLTAAMNDYKRGVMAGMNDNVERLTGKDPMSVSEFARKHADVLNPQSGAVR